MEKDRWFVVGIGLWLVAGIMGVAPVLMGASVLVAKIFFYLCLATVGVGFVIALVHTCMKFKKGMKEIEEESI